MWFFDHPQSTTIRWSPSPRFSTWGECRLNVDALNLTADEAADLARRASEGDAAAMNTIRGY